MAIERGTTSRLSLSNFARKLSLRNRDYSKVEDLYDTRIPLHNEEAFQHGIRFKAKFIGSLEIARPTCKIDIITAMRRIRYEYKVKGIRKIRAYMNISTTGVKITKRKRKRSRKKYSEEQLFIMQHPIYRIFYVSHDSQDLKIFSYITREVPNNTFRCNVFKAYKKGLALSIVRSLGQAFDVCHRLNPKPKKKKEETEESGAATQEGVAKEGGGGDSEKTVKEETAQEPTTTVPSTWKQFNTDLDTALESGVGGAGGSGSTATTGVSGGISDKDIANLNKDLMQLNFDPFSAPLANGSPLSMDPFQPGGQPGGMAVSGATGPVTYPPLTVSNLSTSLPDFPDGVDPATASAQVPPPHMAILGRPRPRPSISGQQQVITENMFTDPNQSRTGNESPDVSIGEALDSSTHRRTASNPFQQDAEKEKWEAEKKQFSLQMGMMKEQLDSEKAARIESQARVEHLLMQNKELLSHLQKLMGQLAQIQTLQQTLSASAATPTSQQTTPAPANSDQEPLLGKDGGEASAPAPKTSTPTLSSHEIAPPTSDMSLGLDFNFTPGAATNDPFVPLASDATTTS